MNDMLSFILLLQVSINIFIFLYLFLYSLVFEIFGMPLSSIFIIDSVQLWPKQVNFRYVRCGPSQKMRYRIFILINYILFRQYVGYIFVNKNISFEVPAYCIKKKFSLHVSQDIDNMTRNSLECVGFKTFLIKQYIDIDFLFKPQFTIILFDSSTTTIPHIKMVGK